MCLLCLSWPLCTLRESAQAHVDMSDNYGHKAGMAHPKPPRPKRLVVLLTIEERERIERATVKTSAQWGRTVTVSEYVRAMVFGETKG